MDPSELLGQKLLQGWTMLGDTCVNCCAPLMRSRDGSHTLCAVCENRTSESKKPPMAFNAYEIPEAVIPVINATSSERFELNVKSLVESILDRLDISLKDVSYLPMFCDIIESGLKPLEIILNSLDKSVMIELSQKIKRLESKIVQALNQLDASTGQGTQENLFYFSQKLCTARDIEPEEAEMKKVSIVPEKSNLSRHLQTYYPDVDSSDTENNALSLSAINSNSQQTSSSLHDQKRNNTMMPDSTLITGYNSHLRSRLTHTNTELNETESNITIGVFPNEYTQPRRHMYSKASDRSDAIDSRIVRMARKWTSLQSSPCSFEELANPGHVSPDPVITVGRIVCDSDAKLNENSVLLESSRCIGSGIRIPLSLSSVPAYSLFPGQIVMVKGINSDGKCFHVQEFLQPTNSLLKIPKLPEAYADYALLPGEMMSVMIAAGPYSLHEKLDYSPLSALLTSAVSIKPELLLLTGPFVDIENAQIVSGRATSLPEQIFKQEILYRLEEFQEMCPRTRIALIPSLNDTVVTDYIYPQPAMKQTSGTGNLLLLSNPALFVVNEICFSIGVNDCLFGLAKESISRSNVPIDRMNRLASHLLEQSSIYPQLPPQFGANLDYDMLDKLEFAFTPDILISPSSLTAFARSIDSGSSVCLNPGLFCRKNALGTAALLSIGKPTIDKEEDKISERLRVDFIQF